MQSTQRCPECSAPWPDGGTCRDHFDQMLAWEFEDPGGVERVGQPRHSLKRGRPKSART